MFELFAKYVNMKIIKWVSDQEVDGLRFLKCIFFLEATSRLSLLLCPLSLMSARVSCGLATVKG